MVSTDDKKILDILMMLRSHGWSKDLTEDSHQSFLDQYKIENFHSPFVFYEPGFNLRSTDLNAFLGIGQLEKLDWIISKRNENHKIYMDMLGGKFYVQKEVLNSVICSISFGLIADHTEQRNRIVKALVENGVETRIFSAGNLGLHPFWVNRFGKASFPVADRIHHCGLFLPNHPSLNEKDVHFIAEVVLGAM